MITAKKPGFMLLDVILFVALAGVFYLAISQMIPKKRTGQDLDELFLSLNSLCALATQEAVCKQLPACLEFKPSSKNGQMQVRAKIVDYLDKTGKKVFSPIKNGFVQNKFSFPKSVHLISWWTDQGKSGDSNQTFAINISPQGFCQVAILHLTEVQTGVEKPYSAIINPFLAKFKNYPGFVEMPTSKNE